MEWSGATHGSADRPACRAPRRRTRLGSLSFREKSEIQTLETRKQCRNEKVVPNTKVRATVVAEKTPGLTNRGEWGCSGGTERPAAGQGTCDKSGTRVAERYERGKSRTRHHKTESAERP